MKYELVIIGAGLTGIETAIQAYEEGLKSVLIVDYNDQFGGFNSALFKEDEFDKERELVEKFSKLPYEKLTNATVTGLFEAFGEGNHEINIQTPSGTLDVEAEAIIICSGALEKPREAHKIGGTRPAGVMTPMMAVGLLERGYLPGEDVLLFENSKTSQFLSTYLSDKGVNVKGMKAEDYLIHMIYGKSRVEKVEIKNKTNGQIEAFDCDTLIFSEGFIPSTFYLKGTGIELNEEHFIVTDDEGKTSVEKIFAFGYCTTQSETSTERIKKSIKRCGNN